MENILKKAIDKYCGGKANCKKYIDGFLSRTGPNIKVGYKCECKNKRD